MLLFPVERSGAVLERYSNMLIVENMNMCLERGNSLEMPRVCVVYFFKNGAVTTAGGFGLTLS